MLNNPSILIDIFNLNIFRPFQRSFLCGKQSFWFIHLLEIINCPKIEVKYILRLYNNW